MRREFVSVLAALMMMGLWCHQASAQGVFGTITGTIFDSSGGVLPGAAVTVTNLRTNVAKTLTTNEAGVYSAPNLIPGSYKVEASLAGFKTAVVEAITLEANTSPKVDLTLEVGRATELVNVRAQAPLLQAEHTDLGQTVTEQQIEQLPTGRDLYSLIPLAAGVSQQVACDGDCGNNANLRINGDRPRTQDYVLDGTTINAPVFGGQSINPSIDVMQEFRIESNSMSAEYGKAGGGVLIAVTKSGTNEFHGSGYEYHRNEQLNARNFFEDRTAPQNPFERNEFGGSFGGPALKNRLFFFVGYQGVRADTSSPVVGLIVPNEAFRNGDLSAVCAAGFDAGGTCADASQQIFFPGTTTPVPFNRIPSGELSSISRNFMAQMPTAGPPGLNPGTLELSDTSATDTSRNQVTTRVDYQISSSDQVFGVMHANWGPSTTRRTNPIPTERTSHAGEYTFSTAWTRIFTPTVLNSFRFGYMQRKAHFLGTGSPAEFGLQGIPACLSSVPGLEECGIPSVNITGFASLGGGNPFYEPANTFHISDTFSQLLGRHSLKVGGEARRISIDNYQPNSPNGDFDFRGTATGHPFADFLFGVMDTGAVNLQNAMVQTRAWSYSLFVQDDFKITPTLTLNLGLRWQYDQSVREKNNALAFFNPYTAEWEQFGVNAPETPFDPSFKQFAPRVGVAWSATPTLVVRGGYGITYPGWVGHGRAGDGEVSPNVLAGTTFPAGTDWENLPPVRNPDPSAIAAPIPVAGTVSFVYWAPREQTPPRFHLWNLTVEKQLDQSTVVQVGYVGSAGRHLPINYGYNICQQTPETTAQFGYDATTSPNCPLAAEKVLAGGGSLYDLIVNPGYWGLSSSDYHSFQAKFERRFSGGISLLTNFTWSKLMDDSSSDWSGFWSLDVLGQDFYNRAAERSVSAGDIPLRLTVAPIVELPFGADHRWLNSGVASQVLGGWRAAAVYTVSSGSPFGITDNSYGYCNAAHTLTNRPTMLGDPLPSGFNQTIDRWFDTDAFDFSGTCPTAHLLTPTAPKPGVGDPNKAFGNAPRYFDDLRNPVLNNIDFSLQKDFALPGGDQRRLRIRADFFNLLNHPQFGEPVSDPTDGNFSRIVRTSVNNRTVQLGVHVYF
jgi:Carboxypeptidase regulatory-like domain/TonB dependent receptor-like, beta-barrel